MHHCSSCSGCSGDLTLTEGELSVLRTLAQIPFLPIYREISEDVPIYLEESAYPQETYGLILQCLEKKRLITLDYDKPLKNAPAAPYPIQGSMTLTARGLMVVDLLERQGITP